LGSGLPTTADVWFYEHSLPEGVKNYTKTRPMQFEEFQPLLDWWDAPQRAESERAWKVPAAQLMQYDANGNLLTVNLDVKNPSRAADLEHLPPAALAESIAAKEQQILGLMDEIKKLLA
jgi:type I restriction enzyme M protein